MRRASIVVLILAAGCGGSSERAATTKTCEPTEGAVEAVDRSGAATENRVRLGPGMELKATKRNLAAARVGESLVVTGVVRGEDCAPLAGATINAWQTNGNGQYGPRRDGRDLCCYLAGTVRTGEDGRYTLDTVMPRGYDGGPAHIHMQAGHPEAQGVTTELVLDAPAATTEFDLVLRD